MGNEMIENHHCSKIPDDVEVYCNIDIKIWGVTDAVTGDDYLGIQYCPFCGEELK